MLNPIDIGNKIKTERIKHGISQEGLADRLYVTRQAVSKWEMGLTLPSIDNICLLSEMFGVGIEDLLCMNKSAPLTEENATTLSNKFLLSAVKSGEVDFDVCQIMDNFSREERLAVVKNIKNFLENNIKNPLTAKLNVHAFWLKLNEEEKQIFNMKLYKEEVKNAHSYFANLHEHK